MSFIQPTRYEPSSKDRLWLLRAVQAEGPPHRDVASALINRFILLRSKGGYWRRRPLHQFVRAYSSPVNPRRMRGGDKWEAAYAKADADGRKKLEALSEKRQEHSRRDVFDEAVMAAVDAAITEGPRRREVTDFAAYDHPPSRGLKRVTEGSRGVNALYTANPSWPGYSVATTVAPHPTPAGKLVAVLVFVFVVAKALEDA